MYASTEELQGLSERIKAIEGEIGQLSVSTVLQAATFVQSHIGCLYYFSSAISYLDMILSFVGFILSTPGTCTASIADAE